MNLLLHHVKFGGNRTTHVGVRRQSAMFLVFVTSFDSVGNVVTYFNKT